MNILFILQTHSVGNSQDTTKTKLQRYTGTDKAEVTKRCVRSLIASINYCQAKCPDVNYHLHVYDDHSDDQSFATLKDTLTTARFKTSVESLYTRGIMSSIRACYEYGKEYGTELVYFIQDDYLFYETAIWEMIDIYFQAVNTTKKRVCICPYDHPYRYDIRPPTVGPILLGAKRHWKVAYHTPATFMFHHDTIVEDWDLFEDFTRQDPLSNMCEDLTLNRLFSERGTLLFTPIPSCALHLQYQNEKDPYLNWAELWDQFKDSDVQKLDFSLRENILLNVGCGPCKFSDSLFTEDLQHYEVISVDIDPNCGPNIVSSMDYLPMIADNSVSCIYSSHSLEHLPWHKVSQCLNEWSRVLKRGGGHMRIIVPNLKYIADYILKGNILDEIYTSPGGVVTAFDMLYGHRDHVASGNSFMCHKSGFTKESAKQLLTSLVERHVIDCNAFQVEEHDTNLVMKIYK